MQPATQPLHLILKAPLAPPLHHLPPPHYPLAPHASLCITILAQNTSNLSPHIQPRLNYYKPQAALTKSSLFHIQPTPQGGCTNSACSSSSLEKLYSVPRAARTKCSPSLIGTAPNALCSTCNLHKIQSISRPARTRISLLNPHQMPPIPHAASTECTVFHTKPHTECSLFHIQAAQNASMFHMHPASNAFRFPCSPYLKHAVSMESAPNAVPSKMPPAPNAFRFPCSSYLKHTVYMKSAPNAVPSNMQPAHNAVCSTYRRTSIKCRTPATV